MIHSKPTIQQSDLPEIFVVNMNYITNDSDSVESFYFSIKIT